MKKVTTISIFKKTSSLAITVLIATLLLNGCLNIFLSSDYFAYESCRSDCSQTYAACFYAGLEQNLEQDKGLNDFLVEIILFCSTIYNDCHNKCYYVEAAD